ncbi:deaminase domain-containing protein [Paenibacillus faecalis]|uniref:deaminase domain-containing protein n=1 Tax=Paenibacillus faecalis TaxID=2079532 RepID=UPI000D114C72|nr:deaminase domain-containing protein [Paenibacillus faecalis]
MSRILVLPQLLFRVADEFEKASIQLGWMVSSLDSQITTMLVWEGTTRQRFFEDFQRANKEMTSTIELMNSISGELKNIAGRFLLFDGEMHPIIPVSSSDEEPKTWQDHIEDFGEGIKAGAINLGESIVDTGKALFEDPLGTLGQMAYNATIGTVEEVIDTGVWGAKMIVDDKTREEFNEKINESGGTANYLGEQGAMLAGGYILGRVGVKKKGDGDGPPKKDEGEGENRLPNRTIDSLYKKNQNVRGDINREIEKVRNSEEYKNLSKTQRDKLDRKLRKLSSGNVAVADVSIPSINKEFQAHSQIHSSDSVGSNVGDFSYSKVDKSLETYVDDEFPRFNDTEAKILEDIASQIKDPNVKGRIDLFTELDACQSCSNLIMEFRRKFPNIQLNVYSKNMR